MAIAVAGAVHSASPASASAASAAPTNVTGSAQQLLNDIPVLPKMTQGFTTATFANSAPSWRDGRGCSAQQRALIAMATVRPKVTGPNCRIRGGEWAIDFGTRTTTDASAIRLVPVIPAPAAWAAGAYSWTAPQRSLYIGDLGDTPLIGSIASQASPDGAQPSADTAVTLPSVRWGASHAMLSSALASRVTKACANSDSSTCLIDVVPEPLKARTAAAIIATSTRHRLSVNRVEKALLEPWVDHFTAEAPDAVLTIATTDVPALPTTDGSDASGRLVTEDLFGLLAPPAWNSTPNVPYRTLRLWDSGVLWKDVEPSPGKFTWAPLDYAVRTAEQQGKKVLLVLGPVPAWASANPNSPDESWGKGAPGPFTADGLAHFDRYVNAVVKRYGDRIWAYETWNEANLQTFWQGSPAQMAVMTKVVYDAVQGHGASSLTLSASATTRTENSIYRFFPAYLRELGKRGWPLDGFAVHAYPDADGTPSDVADFVAQYKAYLAIANAPVKPIYNTELNYGLAGPGPKPHRDMSEEESAGWLSRTFIDAVRLGIEETHWFAWTPQYYGQYGIQLTPTSTASGRAWRMTHDWLVGATFRSCRDPDGTVICEFTRNGSPFWLAYADSTELIDAPEGATRWCDLSNVCRPIDGSMVIVGVRPIRLS